VTQEYCDVLILSASYGGGHNQVDKALTQALKMQDPAIRVITVDYCDLLAPLLTRLSQFGYMQSLRHFPVGYALYYQATGKMSPDSFWQRRLNRMGYAGLISLVNRFNPGVIVSTFPLAAGVLSEMKENGELDVPIITVITDYCVHSQWVHPYTDLYLVGSSEMVDGLMERGIPASRIAVTGIPILPYFYEKYDPAAVKRAYGISPQQKLVLFMGGSDGVFGSLRFSHILKDLPQSVTALVITGSNQELYEKLVAISEKYPMIKPVRYIENVAAVMEAADVLVTKAGGITVSEALAKRLPMVIYKPNPGQEEANANYLWRHRVAIIAKRERRMKTAICRMVTDAGFRERMSRRCEELGKPDAAVRCARIIYRMLRPLPRTANLYKKTVRREIRA